MRFEPWKCPQCDEPARGSIETIPGVALLVFDDDGHADYAGETEIDWNGQTTRKDAAGKVCLVCPNSHRWAAEFVENPTP